MKMKKQLLALLLAAVMVLSLTGCKETLKKVAQKVTGHSEEVQEEDTTRWAEATADPLIIQGIADASAKDATATADGCLYAVFNGIWSRNTGYFTVPGGSLNIMACGTAEGTQKFKVALWKKVDGGAAYVPDSTYYVKTDGTDYRCTISGLDPAAQYRVTISYECDFGTHGRGEQQCVTLLGHICENGINAVRKSHVQHFVRLVHNHVLDGGE